MELNEEQLEYLKIGSLSGKISALTHVMEIIIDNKDGTISDVVNELQPYISAYKNIIESKEGMKEKLNEVANILNANAPEHD